MVDQRRDPAIRVELQEPRLLVLPGVQVELDHLRGTMALTRTSDQPKQDGDQRTHRELSQRPARLELLQQDGDLPAIEGRERRAGRVKCHLRLCMPGHGGIAGGAAA